MPIYPPRESQSFKKKEIVAKREKKLLHALKNHHNEEKIWRAAEKVIEAKLNFIKSTIHLAKIKISTKDQKESKHIINLEKQKDELLSINAEEVIKLYKNITTT